MPHIVRQLLPGRQPISRPYFGPLLKVGASAGVYLGLWWPLDPVFFVDPAWVLAGTRWAHLGGADGRLRPSTTQNARGGRLGAEWPFPGSSSKSGPGPIFRTHGRREAQESLPDTYNPRYRQDTGPWHP